jgi:hypothetical protein
MAVGALVCLQRRGDPKYEEKNLFNEIHVIATLSITSPSWAGLGLNPVLHGEEPVTSCGSHDTASLGYLADDTCMVPTGTPFL